MWVIEEYFRSVGTPFQAWAVSPVDETTWPADESVVLDGKFFGLQFKRPDLADPRHGQLDVSLDRLKWDLGSDARQFALVKRCPEIFYCLPTFVNQQWKAVSLHHCLIWRPTRRMGARPVWYENPQIRAWNGRIERHESCFRWGAFIERILECQIGIPVTQGDRHAYFSRFKSNLTKVGFGASVRSRGVNASEERNVEGEPLYLINLGMNLA